MFPSEIMSRVDKWAENALRYLTDDFQIKLTEIDTQIKSNHHDIIKKIAARVKSDSSIERFFSSSMREDTSRLRRLLYDTLIAKEERDIESQVSLIELNHKLIVLAIKHIDAHWFVVDQSDVFFKVYVKLLGLYSQMIEALQADLSLLKFSLSLGCGR